jgi:hypothetical protein
MAGNIYRESRPRGHAFLFHQHGLLPVLEHVSPKGYSVSCILPRIASSTFNGLGSGIGEADYLRGVAGVSGREAEQTSKRNIIVDDSGYGTMNVNNLTESRGGKIVT